MSWSRESRANRVKVEVNPMKGYNFIKLFFYRIFMLITIYEKNISLNDAQKDYINEKIGHLKNMGVRIDDESSLVKVEVEETQVKTTNEKIRVVVNMVLPGSEARADVHAVSVEEGIDLAEEKLRKQLEKYKAKS